MKRIIALAASAAALMTTSALAADLPSRPFTKAPPIETFSWAGFYIGAHGGYAWGRDRATDLNGVGENGQVDPKGGFGGVQVGYNNYIAKNWVLGYELDFSAGRIRGTGATTLTPLAIESKTDYFGTARARLGYAADHWLIYGTGGMAWVHNDYAGVAPALTVYSRDQFYVGYALGAGVEYAFDRNWSAKAEYLYADFSKNKTVGSVLHQNNDLTLNMVRVGLNYRFNDFTSAAAAPGYPVKARPLALASWGGTYIGAAAGYGWADLDASIGLTSPTPATSLKPTGGFGALVTGANWMVAPNALFGLESETALASLKDNGTNVVTTATGKINAFGSERARLGYVANDWLFYVTGGLGWAHAKFTDGLADIVDTYRVGWTAGGGVEYMFAPLWSAKVEYLRADYGTYNTRISSSGAPQSFDLTTDTVRVGVNYHGDLLGALFQK